MRWSIDRLTISIFVKNNSAPLFKNVLSFLCSNFVTINEIINEILKVKSDFALEVWVSILLLLLLLLLLLTFIWYHDRVALYCLCSLLSFFDSSSLYHGCSHCCLTPLNRL